MKCATCKGEGHIPDPRPDHPMDRCENCSGRGYTSNAWQPGFFQMFDCGPLMATVFYSTTDEEWQGKIELTTHFGACQLFVCYTKTEKGAKDQCELWIRDVVNQMRGEQPNVSPMQITRRSA